MPHHLENLTTAELKALPQEKTLFLIPLGAYEEFGPHLPMSTGVRIAEGKAKHLANKLEKEGYQVVLFPRMLLGMQTESNLSPLTVRAHVLRDWLVDIASSLRELGFSNVFCLSSNEGPKQLTAIEDAMKVLNRKSYVKFKKITLLSLNSGLTHFKKCFSSPFWPKVSEHGGKTQTSQLLAVEPSQVKASYQTLPEASVPKGFWDQWIQRASKKNPPYWGNPSLASSEVGEKEIEQEINQVYQKLMQILKHEKKPAQLFRSWYSVIPTNGSFFWAWMISLALVFLFVFWMAWVGASLPI